MTTSQFLEAIHAFPFGATRPLMLVSVTFHPEMIDDEETSWNAHVSLEFEREFPRLTQEIIFTVNGYNPQNVAIRHHIMPGWHIGTSALEQSLGMVELTILEYTAPIIRALNNRFPS